MLSANGEAGTPSKVQVLPSEFGGVACGVAALLEDSMSLNDTEKQNIGNFFDPNYLLKYYLPATSPFQCVCFVLIAFSSLNLP